MATFSVSSEAEVVGAVRGAREGRRTLEIVGHGTKRDFGRPLECDDVLDLSGLSGIVNYEPDEMIITARAGTPVAEIEAALAEHNQRLGFEPADWGPLFGASANSATIGGVLSASCDGSAAIRYGRCRDHLLGFRAVNGFGEAYKGGGKVVKNVTGFDLPKLFCGAMGTLGPLTEVTLRLFPRPPLIRTVAVTDVSRFAATNLLRRIWSSPLEATGLSYVPKVSGAAFGELGEFGAGAALVRLDGTDAALSEKIAMLRELVERHDVIDLDGGDRTFRKIASGESFAGMLQDVWLVRQPPHQPGDYEESEREAAYQDMWVADWAGALIWRAGTPGKNGAHLHQMQKLSGGSAQLIRASEQTRQRAQVFAREEPVRAELTQRVKAAFDPLHLFNPGRMWEGV